MTEYFQISEELLTLVSLRDQTSGCDLFDAVSDANHQSNLKWCQLAGVTMDGAPHMTGVESGLVALLRKKAIEYSKSDLIH